MNILITGCAGFIGFHLCKHLLDNYNQYNIYGLDCLSNYYDVRLKKNRLKILNKSKQFKFYKCKLQNKIRLGQLFKNTKFNIVINLAAQAGVRYSISHPREYMDSNIIGFYNILENSVRYKINHFIYASTSSVYGDAKKFPLKEDHNTDNPLSFCAATKKCNEVIAHSFSEIYKIPTTGLRFFTVYGPYGRPDMALFKFTKNILEGKKINLFNKGNHYRDFTYIEDIVISISKLIKKPSKKNTPYNIFNIGGGSTIHLKQFIDIIERNLNKKSKINFLKKQIGDVFKTQASNRKLSKYIKFFPRTNIDKGINQFINWYKEYYGR